MLTILDELVYIRDVNKCINNEYIKIFVYQIYPENFQIILKVENPYDILNNIK